MLLQRFISQIFKKSFRGARIVQQRYICLNAAKKSSQYAEASLTHMIDIFLCPDQDYYYSALEGKTKTVHPENIRICESLLR